MFIYIVKIPDLTIMKPHLNFATHNTYLYSWSIEESLNDPWTIPT